MKKKTLAKQAIKNIEKRKVKEKPSQIKMLNKKQQQKKMTIKYQTKN